MSGKVTYIASIFAVLFVGYVIVASLRVGAPPPIGVIFEFAGGRTNQYCGVGEGKEIRCDKRSGDSSAEFVVEDQFDGTFALKSVMTGQYCHDQGNRVVCHSDVVRAHEKFHWIDQGANKFSMTGPKSGSKRLFCADDQTGNIVCNRPVAGAWETFSLKRFRADPSSSIPVGRLVEGMSVSCQGDGKVYRYTEGILRHYPNPVTASAWNPNWGANIRVLSPEECSTMTIGVPMTMPNGVSKTSVSPTQPTMRVYNVNSSLPNASGAIETYKEGTALNTTSVFIGVVVGALVVGGGAMWTRRPRS
eukprot:evm.model.NODE_2949_length_6059_cov_81.798149.3